MKYQTAFASEIDPYASAVSQYNHPDVNQMGELG